MRDEAPRGTRKRSRSMRKNRYCVIGAVLLPAVAAVVAGGAAPAAGTALDDYVATPDASYTFSLVSQVNEAGATAYVLDMTSQPWRTAGEVDRPEWQHWLTLTVPDTAMSLGDPES